MSKVNRNEPCPCGSGKKYKNCHQDKTEVAPNKSMTFVISAIVIIFLLLAGLGLFLGSGKSDSSKPDGLAPAGKTWSEEHQHYH